jgi:hemoglobin/transferrin/lactoferrin receptor protein
MGSRSARPLLLACTALVAVSAILPAHAQDATTSTTAADGEETRLQTIVIKGKRVPAGSVADTPLATHTTAEELRHNEIADAGDIGSTVDPAVEFVRTRPGASGGLFIRGLGGPRIATLIDGIPVPFLENAARSSTQSPTTTTGDSTDSIEFSSLSAMDVLKGADSSRLGSGGLGGGLSLRTLEPEDLIGGGRDWGGVAKTTYDSTDRSIGGSLAVAKKIENTSVLFQGAYKKGHETDNQGVVDSTGLTRTEANPADYKQYNILLKARQDIEGGHRIGVTAERFRRDVDTDLKTIQGTGSGTIGVYQPDYVGDETTARDRVSLEYSYEAPESGGWIDTASLIAYWQRLEKAAGSTGTRLRTQGPSAGTSYLYDRDNSLEESSYGLTGETVSRFNYAGSSHELRFGGNVAVFGAESFLSATPATATTVSQSDMPDIDGVRLGLFAEDKITINDGPLSITPGIRFDLYDYNTELTDDFTNNTGYPTFGLPDDSNGNAFSPKLLAQYQVNQELSLFAQWSMAYRAPTISELYVNFTNGTQYTVIGNPELEPETANGFELGADYSGTDLDARVTVFHNKYKNFIEVYNPNIFGANDQSWRNVGKVDISGVEVTARKDLANGFSIYGSLAYAYGKNKDTDELLRTVAPFKAIAGVTYATETWGADFSGVFSAGMRDDGTQYTSTGLAYETFDAPGYGIFNLTGWWEPEEFKGLRIQAGVYNIFDRKYWNGVATRDVQTTGTTYQPVDYYSEPGRTFKISLTQKF